MPSYSDLVDQSGTTIKTYLTECVEMLDEIFGSGYAKANPALLASLVNNCNQDFIFAALSKDLRDGSWMPRLEVLATIKKALEE